VITEFEAGEALEVQTRRRPLVGRHAIVTGASSAIGRAIVLELVRKGATVEAGYLNNEQGAQVTKTMADQWNPGAVTIRQINVATRLVITELDADILVNNAGITAGKGIRSMDRQSWDSCIETNLTAAVSLTQLLSQGMVERGWGRIVNIASVVGMDGRLGPSSYAASKAGLIGFTKAVAHELASKGVTVNAVAPGFIDGTGMFDAVDARYKLKIQEQIPMHRYGTVEDVAQAVGYLVTADYVTGTVLNVSGGYLT